MGFEQGLAVASTFVWLGMVLAISFLEAPLKFRAPDVTLRIGLGIGRLVFRALNACEALFALVLVVLVLVDAAVRSAATPIGIAVLALAAQVLIVRPVLTRRTDAVLAGAEVPRSRAHYAYVALELIKAVALVVGGVALLA